jgi:hypothetical protein
MAVEEVAGIQRARQRRPEMKEMRMKVLKPP